MYEAIESRARDLATLTDQSPAFAKLVRSVAMGIARWSEATRNDVASAAVEVQNAGEFLVVRVRPTGLGGPQIRKTVILTTFANAVEFLRRNQSAIDLCISLCAWALPQIAKGATSFETRWNPSDGYLAIRAVHSQSLAS